MNEINVYSTSWPDYMAVVGNLIFAPFAPALRQTVKCCEVFVNFHHQKYNPDRTLSSLFTLIRPWLPSFVCVSLSIHPQCPSTITVYLSIFPHLNYSLLLQTYCLSMVWKVSNSSLRTIQPSVNKVLWKRTHIVLFTVLQESSVTIQCSIRLLSAAKKKCPTETNSRSHHIPLLASISTI